MTEMHQLLYGIVLAEDLRAGRPIPLPPGAGGAAVRLIEACGLGAAVSGIDPRDAEPTVAHALAYARVVDALHALRTVVSMRFGCVLQTESSVLDLLRARRGGLARMLREIHGCAEMTVRVEKADAGGPRSARNASTNGNGRGTLAGAGEVQGDGPPRCPPNPAAALAPGAAYLARRWAVYAETDRQQAAAAHAAERVQRELVGRFVRCRAEAPARSSPGGLGASLASVYFLVRREAVESFREAFSELSRRQEDRLVLSGPWPPYNFVVGEPGGTRIV